MSAPSHCRQRTAYVPGMTRDEFVAAHVRVCTCSQVKKYDRARPKPGMHSLEYSRKKCAKALWRKLRARPPAAAREAA